MEEGEPVRPRQIVRSSPCPPRRNVPELPEVETMVRGIRPHVMGRRVVEFKACACACRPIEMQPGVRAIAKRVKGRMVVAVARRAKRVLLELDSGDGFAIEPRMTGLVLLNDPPDPQHLRCVWRFEPGQAHDDLWFWDRRGLGTVRLLTASQLDRLRNSADLGPDALDLTADLWHARCGRTSRPIKVALLDQKLVAGIGNLYASEILHVARIHPERPANRLSAKEVSRLAAAAEAVLTEAIRLEGSTLGDGTYRNALNRPGGYQNAHRVYQKHDEPCPRCRRGAIVRIVQAQRATFFCPRCQR